MSKVLQYKVGSFIYVMGEASDTMFILRAGSVQLIYQDIKAGVDLRDPVQPGEFFGVKSALGRSPREESVLALSDTVVMALTVSEFEALALTNTRIVMKMLRVFSKELRRIHKLVSNLMETKEQNPENGLFGVGEYYLKNKRFAQAKQVFSRYLIHYPTGKYVEATEEHLKAVEKILSQGLGSTAKRSLQASDGEEEQPDTEEAAHEENEALEA
jgi:CRP-like cAMP-binding protein